MNKMNDPLNGTIPVPGGPGPANLLPAEAHRPTGPDHRLRPNHQVKLHLYRETAKTQAGFYLRRFFLLFCIVFFAKGPLIYGQAVTPFDCSNMGYQTVATQSGSNWTTALYAYNVATGIRQQVGSSIHSSLMR